jgi:dTDP-4-dehydrorhamnose reductase
VKVLVTGAAGQLGRETVLALQQRGVEVQGVTRADVDFSVPEAVERYFATRQADWVIHCAAYTQVDKAEAEAELAYRVNRDSAAALARAVNQRDGRLLHVSTDFIFSGHHSRPYREQDAAAPLGVYGDSKWQGEQQVMAELETALIVRTGWVYGVHGHNFVKTMLHLGAQRDELRVVDDQVGTPSATADIVRALLALVGADVAGIYHFSNEGVASWYDFAVAILARARQLGWPLKVGQVIPIPTEDYPTAATRPGYSVLSKEKIRGLLDYPIPHWTESLEAMLGELQRREAE